MKTLISFGAVASLLAVTACATGPSQTDEPVGSTHASQDKASPDGDPAECDNQKWIMSVAGLFTGTFFCVLEGGEIGAGCVVGGAVTLGAACAAAVGAVAFQELTPGMIPGCMNLPENLYTAVGVACRQARAARTPKTADDLDAWCKAGRLRGTQSFCARGENDDPNHLYNCVDGQWNLIQTCEVGCQQNDFGLDVCKFL